MPRQQLGEDVTALVEAQGRSGRVSADIGSNTGVPGDVGRQATRGRIGEDVTDLMRGNPTGSQAAATRGAIGEDVTDLLAPKANSQPAAASRDPLPARAAAQLRPGQQINPKTGTVMNPAPPLGEGVIDPLLLSMPEGATRAGRGVRDLVTGGDIQPTGQRTGRMRALADVLGGTLEAGTPLLVASGIAAPLRTLAGVGTGTVAGTAAAKGAQALGASPAAQEVAGALSGIAAGSAAAGATGRSAGTPISPVNSEESGLSVLARWLRIPSRVAESTPTDVTPSSEVPTAQVDGTSPPLARYTTHPGAEPEIVGETPRTTPAPRGMSTRVRVDAERVRQQATDDPSLLGGHRTMADIQAEAETRAIGPRTAPAENFKDSAEAAAYILRRKHAADAFNDLSERHKAGTLAPDDLPAYEAALEATKQAARDEIRGFSEQGRTLRVAGQPIDAPTWSVLERGIYQATKAGLDDAAITDVMRTAPNDPDAWVQALREAQQAKQTWRDWARSYYTTNILSDPLTQIKNLIGSSVNLSTRLPLIPIRAATDAIRTALTDAPRSIYAGEVGPQLRAIGEGAKRGARVAADVMRKGYSTEVASTQTGTFDLGRVEFRGGAKNPANLIGRAMEATDQLFRQTAIEMDRAGQLYTAARNEAKAQGVEPHSPAFADIWQSVIDRGVTPGMEKAAQEAGARTGFNEPGGAVTQAVARLKNAYPDLHYAITFVRTVGNLTKQGLEFTPAGALMKGARPSRVGARAASEVQARVVASTAALMPLYLLAANGRLSGSGPRSTAERASLYATGWQPNAIKLGDTWYPYASIQPLAMPASLVANAYEAWTRAGAKGDLPTMLFNVALGSARSVLQQSYFANINGILQSLNEEASWEGRAASTLARTASGFIPASGLLRGVTRATDSVLRRPTTAAEGVAAALPGASTRIDPRLDQFGQPITRPGGSAVSRALNPFPGTVTRHDPVVDAMMRTGTDITPAHPDPFVSLGPRRQAPLSKKDAFTFGQNKNQAVYDMLRPILEQPNFREEPPELQRSLIEALTRRARELEERQARLAVMAGTPITPYAKR